MLTLDDELAYVLHTIPYRNSSLICDVLTENHGRVKLLAFSARGPKSRFRGIFGTFNLLKISARGKSELKKVSQADCVDSVLHLQSTPLFCGYYMHELIQHCLAVEDPAKSLFEAYQLALKLLSQPDAVQWEVGLRIFEKALLEQCGFGIDFLHDYESGDDIHPDYHYQFMIDLGFKQTLPSSSSIPGHILLSIAAEFAQHDQQLPYLKTIFRQAIASCLQGKQLQSKALLKVLL